VLFENFQTFNSRSEHRSVFRQSLFANPLLVAGVISAQALHVGAMHVPIMSETLGLSPVLLSEWAVMLAFAFVLLVVMEFDKWWDRRYRLRARSRFDGCQSRLTSVG
jgi:Ca2+-transporting ATPase